MKRRTAILVVDDDPFIITSLSEFLHARQFKVCSASSGKEGIEKFDAHQPPLVLLDQKLPDRNGLDICKKLLEINPRTKIIFITAHATVRYAVDAMQAGAFNYLSKPFSLDELLITINMALNSLQIEDKLRVQEYNRQQERQKIRLIGSSLVMDNLHEQIQLAAESDAIVLITGETGVGKSEIARAIHAQQARRETFLSINCAAIPENLVEAEYFGHEKGIFTGADVRREGIFELADGGTLLLDEIGEIPFHLQSKLLTVLEEKALRRIGGSRAIPVDVRIIATTNQKLEQAIEEKRFRQDLYYRLAVIKIHVPPLRRHLEDIPEIATYFAEQFCRKPLSFANGQMDQLMQYRWPGNVRELRNIIERAALVQKNKALRPAELLRLDREKTCTHMAGEAALLQGMEDLLPIDEVLNHYIAHAYRLCNRNKSLTARTLGVSLSTLKRKLKVLRATS
jgi:DNA-binding NtrC family response regulator